MIRFLLGTPTNVQADPLFYYFTAGALVLRMLLSNNLL